MADGIKKVSENVIVDRRALVITDPTVKDNDAISIGALQSNPSTRGLKIKTAKNTYSLFDAAQFIMPGSITTELLKDGCVTTLKLADKSVTEPKLADDAVSERTIIDGNVTESKIGTKAVTETKIGDLAVTTRHYKDESIVNSKIEDNTIENVKLFDKTITNLKIADGTIINSLLAPNSVKELNIAENSIKHEHLKDGSVYGTKIKDAAIKNRHLDVNCVNSQNILNGAVTSDKIADSQILGNHISPNIIESIHLVNQSVTKDKLNRDSVSTDAVIDKAITKDKLADDIVEFIGDPVQYDKDNNVQLRKNLAVNGDVNVVGSLTANKVYNAVFMDIAEAYEPKENETYLPGDIVQLNEEGKIERADSSVTTKNYPIVGVVSDEYACCYGATEEELEAGTKIAVGLIGKVHVNVVGPVKLGEKVGLYKDGSATTVANNNLVKEYIIGKALETNEEHGLKKVLCLIYPN